MRISQNFNLRSILSTLQCVFSLGGILTNLSPLRWSSEADYLRVLVRESLILRFNFFEIQTAKSRDLSLGKWDTTIRLIFESLRKNEPRCPSFKKDDTTIRLSFESLRKYEPRFLSFDIISL